MSRLISKILCKVGSHDFVRISRVVPVKAYNEFDFIVNMYALGQYKRCPEVKMISCWGWAGSYRVDDVKTKAEWMKILVKEEGELEK